MKKSPQVEKNLKEIDTSIKIVLGPTGKNGIFCNFKNEIKFLTSGSLILKFLEGDSYPGNFVRKLLEQASTKTHSLTGDGSTTTILLSCQLLTTCLKFLASGYNNILLSNGIKKISFFFSEKVSQFSFSVSSFRDLSGLLKTSLGKKINNDILNLLKSSIFKIARDGLIVVEENNILTNELEVIQGLELDRGFASSYFVNDLQNFQVIYENSYVLIANTPITSFNQISQLIEYIKTSNRPLVIVAEEISKEILSTLVLNTIQKKVQIAVIKYSSIKFLKTGILEDLASLTHSTYFLNNLKNENQIYSLQDLGQAEKIVIKKDKTVFFLSKFSKLIAKRKINELNRELLNSETNYEKNILKTRIARLSGKITKIKLGISNQYQIQEERQKVENLLLSFQSSLEEGILPGGGVFYLFLREELNHWSYLNLFGDEIFAKAIVNEALLRPFAELCENTNFSKHLVLSSLQEFGYPYSFDFVKGKVVHALKFGLVDSAKSLRFILWNSLSITSSLLNSF